MANERCCANCKHATVNDPCDYCENNCNWESDGLEEPETYTYFVAFYCVDEHDNVVMNNCFIERDEKLRTMEDIKGIREDIKNECCSGNVVIINWKELEG